MRTDHGAASRDSTPAERGARGGAPHLAADGARDVAGDPEPTTMPIDEWYGMMLIDREGFRIGKLHDVYVDSISREPLFAMVKGGFLDRRVTLVPLRGVRVRNDRLQVAATKAEIGSQPDFDLSGDALDLPGQAALFRHFHHFTPRMAVHGRQLMSHWGRPPTGDEEERLAVDPPGGIAT